MKNKFQKYLVGISACLIILVVFSPKLSLAMPTPQVHYVVDIDVIQGEERGDSLYNLRTDNQAFWKISLEKAHWWSFFSKVNVRFYFDHAADYDMIEWDCIYDDSLVPTIKMYYIFYDGTESEGNTYWIGIEDPVLYPSESKAIAGIRWYISGKPGHLYIDMLRAWTFPPDI